MVLTFPVLDMQIYMLCLLLYLLLLFKNLAMLIFTLVNSLALHSPSITEDTW